MITAYQGIVSMLSTTMLTNSPSYNLPTVSYKVNGRNAILRPLPGSPAPLAFSSSTPDDVASGLPSEAMISFCI